MTWSNQEGYTNNNRRKLMLSGAACVTSGFSVGHALASRSSSGVAALPSKPEKRSITIATTQLSALPFLPLWVAQQKGFFEQQGLELHINEHQSAARAIAAVGSGSADLVCGWLENMLSNSGRAISLQSFVLMGRAPMMAMGLSTRLMQEVQIESAHPSHLRGRKLGVVALHSPTHTVAHAALRRAGIRPSDVSFVSVGSPASAGAALRSGQVDALVHMDPLMLQLEQRGEIHNIADLRTPLSTFEALGMHLPSSCVAAPQEFLRHLPATAQACSHALIQALQWLAQASLRDILHLQLNFQPKEPESAPVLDARSFVASYERLRWSFSSDGICEPKLAHDLLHAMHDVEPALRLAKIDVMQSINNTLALRSVAKFKT